MISFSSLLVLHCSILFIIRLLEELVKRKWMHICFSASLWDKISFSNLGNIVQSKKVSLWYLLSVCTEHLKSSFRTQQCAVQGRDSRHLLNGESWQRNGGAVREKPGYTLHCVACTVTLLEACEMRSLVAWVCAQNSKSIWSFGADRKRQVSSARTVSESFHIHAAPDSVWRAPVFWTPPKLHTSLIC